MNFTENFIFETYKDTGLKNHREFKKMLKNYRDVDSYKVYREIANYQIKKYGKSLYDNGEIATPISVLVDRDRKRKRYKREQRGIKTRNAKERRWSE